MGRYIFNQTLAKMISYFGLPTPDIEQPITLEFPIDSLRRRIPEFPQTGKLQITFVKGKVDRIVVRPDFSAKKLFDFLFGYPPPTEITVAASQITGGYNATRCLGDGVGSDIQLQGNGDNFVSFYYNEDFIAPYALLESQQFKLDPQHLDYLTETKNHEYPWLSERRITEADVSGMDLTQLYVMYHSIYARKGLIFYNGFLKRVFGKQSWYQPRYSVRQFQQAGLTKLSAIAHDNADFLYRRFRSQLQP